MVSLTPILHLQDPDVVILTVFEDDARKSLSPTTSTPLPKASRSSRTGTLSTTSTGTSVQQNDVFRFSLDNTPLMKFAHPDGRDHSIIYYYKNFVYRHLAQVHRYAVPIFETPLQNIAGPSSGLLAPIQPSNAVCIF